MTRKRYAVDTVRDEPVRLRDQLDHIAAEGGSKSGCTRSANSSLTRKHHSHHRDGEKRFKESVAVPVEDPDRLARHYTDSCEGARQPPDPVAQFGVGHALQVAVNDLLARCLGERRMKELLDQQRIRIGRRCYGDYSLVHRRSSHLVVRRQKGRLKPAVSLNFHAAVQREACSYYGGVVGRYNRCRWRVANAAEIPIFVG
jgi:hypothetical protein